MGWVLLPCLEPGADNSIVPLSVQVLAHTCPSPLELITLVQALEPSLCPKHQPPGCPRREPAGGFLHA
eukprot:4116628-Lingulodinium_polyedra.AAC.1